MTIPHVFVETNFLYYIFQVPSKRRPDAVALQKRFEAGEVRLYVPYLCFQEARHTIGKKLPNWPFTEILEFHSLACEAGPVPWDITEFRKLKNAAISQLTATKARYPRELKEFAWTLGEGVLHATREVCDFLESFELDGDSLKYNDRLILSSVLVKAKQLHGAGLRNLFFLSLDKGDLEPTAQRPKMTRYYAEAGLTFVQGFVSPDTLAPPA